MAARAHIAVALGVLLAATATGGTHHAAPDAARARIPGATFASILPPGAGVKTTTVAPFEIDRAPVTNAQFAAFVQSHPEWRRDRVARVFADEGYLAHWQDARVPGRRIASQPVTRVSWFAASAYCEARDARLPTWHESELVAAASDTAADARGDEAWRQRILDWYARPATGELPDAGRTPPNYYGVRDVHGVVWEWVLDLGALMQSTDGREQGDPDLARYCGAGAATLEQKENYALFMRIAMLSSMKAHYTTVTMGFRCAADTGPAR